MYTKGTKCIHRGTKYVRGVLNVYKVTKCVQRGTKYVKGE